MNLDVIKKAQNVFNITDNMETYFSPGRVNLIGEHIDYNGGYVLPCALDIGTIGVASVRSDNIIACYSENFSELGVITFSLDNLVYDEKDNWTNYVKGVVKEMGLTKGFNLYVKGDIPNGSGLSSSASLELLVGIVANNLFNLSYSNLELVKISHKSENEFIGVKCGIMDQFIIGMAQEKSGILLNTASLDFHYVRIDLQDYLIVIGNTNKKRTLASSKYNERREECEQGLKMMQQRFAINDLCSLTYEQFLDNQDLITDEVILKRVRHVVSENERTKKAYTALQSNNLIEFGKLMNQSHNSLRDDYEVTGLELDTLQSLFLEYGAIGARMTGAGFGGCTIALVKKEQVNDIIEKVKVGYDKITNLNAYFYLVNIGNGVRKL